MTPLPNNYFAVQVPEDATCIIPNWGKRPRVQYQYWTGESRRGKIKRFNIFLPPGSYTIVGLAKDLTEEQAGEIVEWWDGTETYRSYTYTPSAGETFWPYSTALESFRSLLSSLSLQPETTLIIKLNE